MLLADKLHFLVDGDRMYRFVLLLQYTTPSAVLLGAIASLRGYAVSEASSLLFWQSIYVRCFHFPSILSSTLSCLFETYIDLYARDTLGDWVSVSAF